ncbi:MAG: dihydrolipoyl dehydrogenase, partial [Spirochaetia bacterium]|nr:dihydrolipoyl dehydrogenase [Spirochaetia bacterium]
MSDTFDLVVIGSGPGGYVAAIRAAQLGFKTAIVEKDKNLGGTCLNVGCIPSKALLASSEHFETAQKHLAVHGVDVSGVKLNFAQMMKRKGEVVNATVRGIDYLMGKNKITRLVGTGSFLDPRTLEVKNGSTAQKVSAKYFIVATGSEPSTLPSLPIDGKKVITSTEALSLSEVPKHLLVIGGGVIGVELGQVYLRLGAKVSVVEFMDALIPTMDRELGTALEKSLRKAGMEFYLGHKVTSAKVDGKGVSLTAESSKGPVTLEGDIALVAVGRKPRTKELNLEKAGIKTDERGRITVNAHYETSCPNVFAIGDVIAGPMLAHKASEEGVVCVENIKGIHTHVNLRTIPGVVYTHPEVASVGYTEEELKTAGRKYKKGAFPFKASGRARASEESEGFAKVLADAATDEILGIHLCGPRASDMIAEAVLAMEYRASAEDVAAIPHAHPTYTEAIKEA